MQLSSLIRFSFVVYAHYNSRQAGTTVQMLKTLSLKWHIRIWLTLYQRRHYCNKCQIILGENYSSTHLFAITAFIKDIKSLITGKAQISLIQKARSFDCCTSFAILHFFPPPPPSIFYSNIACIPSSSLAPAPT